MRTSAQNCQINQFNTFSGLSEYLQNVNVKDKFKYSDKMVSKPVEMSMKSSLTARGIAPSPLGTPLNQL